MLYPAKKLAALITAAILAASVALAAPENTTYTLYRNSIVEGITRVHVATFDAEDGEAYNHENCWTAAGLFKSQPGVSVRYWCETGRFRK